MNPKLKDESTDRLFHAILNLQTIEECYAFFEDVGTILEMKSFAQRFDVATMLAERKTYKDIHEETGASEATISRVSRALHYGADGYRLILERMGIHLQDEPTKTSNKHDIGAENGKE